MMKTNFLKCLESSPRSLALTLRRVIANIDSQLKDIRLYMSNSAIVAPSPDMGLFPGDMFETRMADNKTVGDYADPKMTTRTMNSSRLKATSAHSASPSWTWRAGKRTWRATAPPYRAFSTKWRRSRPTATAIC